MLRYKLRFILASLLVIVLCVSFGYFSRYPDLNRKAVAAENHSVGDTISMWPIFKISANDPTWKKIAYSSINWGNDNKKGMAFGIVLAALLACWLKYFQFNPGGRWASAFYGMILGTPLGVCVNCAAPVFKGALRSRRIEMALALMFASPTLNIVVLTMAFTLLPTYMAITKLLYNLVVILVLVPLLAHWLRDAPVKDLQLLDQKLAMGEDQVSYSENLGSAALGFIKDFWEQVSSLFIRTAPLMLLAGFLGATLSHLVPLDALQGQGGFWTLLLAVTVGLILPVPMAFDVVLTNALYSAGIPQNIALVLLLSLGVYSFYSFLITWQSTSRRWAIVIASALWLMILPLGMIAPWMHESFYLSPNIAAYRGLTEHQAAYAAPDGRPALQLAAKSLPAPLALPSASSQTYEGSRITRWPFLPKQGNAGKFIAHEGADLGLDQGFMYTIRDYPDPFWIGRGTAAGDFDQDGWVDVVFGSDHGPLLYHNLGGHFETVPLHIPQLKEARIFSVALIDLDGDQWLDLFVSSFNKGNFWIRNLQGKFAQAAQSLPNGDAILTISPAFADLDSDGRMDIFNGNMALGIATGFRGFGKGRQNGITWNRPQGFIFEPFKDEADGETMASLISDVNGDGRLDLYESNDFIVPDYFYFGGLNGKLNRLKGEGLSQFASPYFSMSVDSGDLNNDLKPDLLVTGTIAAKQDLGDQVLDGLQASEYKKAKDTVDYCLRIKDKNYQDNCRRNRQNEHLIPFSHLKSLKIEDCHKLSDSTQRDGCLLSMMWMIVTNNDDRVDCHERYGFDPKILEICQIIRKAGSYLKREDFAQEAPQVDKAVLYFGQADGGFKRASNEVFDHPGGWTWSSRIADLDNDGWQDIFNAEGAVRKGEFGWNVYLHNENGKFMQKQFSAGLSNDFNLFSFVLIDYDHDGDLDIIGNGSEGPPQIYENQSAKTHHSIAFGIKAANGNTQGLNAKIIIHPTKGPAQMREIKAGGGYQSVDAPRAYFGLGESKSIESFELIPSYGPKREFKGPFAADAYLQIEL